MTLIDSTPRTTPRTDVRTDVESSVPSAPLGGTYVTTRRTAPLVHATMGTYVSSRTSAPAIPGQYVTTAAPSPMSGGSYTYAS